MALGIAALVFIHTIAKAQ